jgi:two-component system nitrogen regulation sensor histidine kinase NtrY
VTRPATSSLSALISVVLLYFLLVGFAIIFSQQLLATLGGASASISTIAGTLAVVFPLSLFVALIFQVVRIARNIRAGLPGNRFKIRLIVFLNSMTLLATLPLAILFYFFLSGLVRTDLITTTQNALQGGVEIALEAIDDRTHQLQAVVNSPLAELLVPVGRSPQTWWANLQALNDPPKALQIFYANGGTQILGNSDLAIRYQDFARFPKNSPSRESGPLGTVLRIKQTVHDPSGAILGIVVSDSIAPALEIRAAILSKAREWFGELTDFKGNIAPIITTMFFLFMLPLILISMLAGFFLADEVIRPLVNFEATMARIAKGDFDVRMAVRHHDQMGFIVSSFNRMMTELLRNRESLKQSERLQTWQDIAQRMAHEIKNPLTPIKLGAQRILRRYEEGSPDLKQVIKESVSTIVQEVDNLTTLLDEFRNFARLPLPIKSRVDMTILIQETWALYAGTGETELDASALEAGLFMNIDNGQFRQVFKNLFQNAIEAMDGRGTVLIRSDRIQRNASTFLRLQVSDTGPGIPANLLPSIFLPYVTSKKHGSGLGLAIVEKIVLDHGGEIRCESLDGRGASFIMEIPFSG